MTQVIPLCVPPWDEGDALRCGALWSPGDKFHVLRGANLETLLDWLPRRFDPRWQGRPPLVPEMLPVQTWELNLRTQLSEAAWDRIRRHIYKSAGWTCEICGKREGRLEAHEQWSLHNETGVQELCGILALCPFCHKCHHLGIAKRLGMLPAVKQHMLQVNNWNTAQLDAAIVEAYELWEQQSAWPWVVDLSWFTKSSLAYV